MLAYIEYVSDQNIRPNPITWLMFAYGTAILTILEFDRDANLAELILPVVCSVMGVFIAYRCWRICIQKNPNQWWPKEMWPDHKADKLAFFGDVLITVGYVAAWLFLFIDILNTEQREFAALIFLFGSNLTTLTAFIPILRTTYQNPALERPFPWLIWTWAYLFLFVLTTHERGLFTEFNIYPVSCMILHGLVGILAVRKAQTSATR